MMMMMIMMMKKRMYDEAGRDFPYHTFCLEGNIPFSKEKTSFLWKNTFFIRETSLSILLPKLFWGQRKLRSFGENIPIQSRQSPGLFPKWALSLEA